MSSHFVILVRIFAMKERFRFGTSSSLILVLELPNRVSSPTTTKLPSYICIDKVSKNPFLYLCRVLMM